MNRALADVYWTQGEQDLLTALDRLYDPDGDGDTSDGARPFFDTLNVHTYQPGAPKQAWYEERLKAVARLMERFGDEEKAIWITKTGYGTAIDVQADSPYVEEEAQADGARAIHKTCSRYPQVERVFWWSLRDYHGDTSANNTAMEAHYGLLRANFAPKPACVAYARLTGSAGHMLSRRAVADAEGVAQVRIPASLVDRPGTYVLFAELDRETRAAVVTYEVEH